MNTFWTLYQTFGKCMQMCPIHLIITKRPWCLQYKPSYTRRTDWYPYSSVKARVWLSKIVAALISFSANICYINNLFLTDILTQKSGSLFTCTTLPNLVSVNLFYIPWLNQAMKEHFCDIFGNKDCHDRKTA